MASWGLRKAKPMTLESPTYGRLWADKHRRMGDAYAILGCLILPTLLGAKGNLLLTLLALSVIAIFFFLPMPFIKRFKSAFVDFGRRFWFTQFIGVLAIVLVIGFPDWRGVIGLSWGVGGFILTFPMMRQMKFK